METLRLMLKMWREDPKHTVDRRNLEDFLNLVDKGVGEGKIEYIRKTNVGAEGAGTDSILMIGTPASPREKQDISIRPFMISKLYEQGDPKSQKVYFTPTYIPYIYVWWEEGISETNEMGTFITDDLKGFVKINKADFERTHK